MRNVKNDAHSRKDLIYKLKMLAAWLETPIFPNIVTEDGMAKGDLYDYLREVEVIDALKKDIDRHWDRIQAVEHREDYD